MFRYMNTMVTTENFPTELCSREAKEQFARAVLKERANKRKLQVAFFVFVKLSHIYIYVEGGNSWTYSHTLPGNCARVLSSLKGSPWFRICSSTGPTGSLEEFIDYDA